MSRIITGLVVGSKNRGDMNKVVELLTPENGTEYIFASGARRLTSRFLPLTKLFTLISVECTDNGNMQVLKDGNVLGGFRSIETDIDKFRIAADVIKNVRIAAANSESKSKIYNLCIAYLGLSDACDNGEVASAAVKFYVYLLSYLGYDVKLCAQEYSNDTALIEICQYLSGKKISHTMTDRTPLDNAAEAYDAIAQIYSALLDMQLCELYCEAEI